jgi:hypothetical protein
VHRTPPYKGPDPCTRRRLAACTASATLRLMRRLVRVRDLYLYAATLCLVSSPHAVPSRLLASSPVYATRRTEASTGREGRGARREKDRRGARSLRRRMDQRTETAQGGACTDAHHHGTAWLICDAQLPRLYV